MDRKEFFTASFTAGIGCCAAALFEGGSAAAQETPPPSEADREKEFVKNWMTDLFDTIHRELDQATKVKLMAGCGRGCFRRFSFKQDIATQGKGSVEKLIAAYKKNFQVWRDGELVHVRYGEKSARCYCPAARFHPPLENDMHCECSRATHQTIFETALERPVAVTIVESLRRGGKTCHFAARVGVIGPASELEAQAGVD